MKVREFFTTRMTPATVTGCSLHALAAVAALTIASPVAAQFSFGLTDNLVNQVNNNPGLVGGPDASASHSILFLDVNTSFVRDGTLGNSAGYSYRIIGQASADSTILTADDSARVSGNVKLDFILPDTALWNIRVETQYRGVTVKESGATANIFPLVISGTGAASGLASSINFGPISSGVAQVSNQLPGAASVSAGLQLFASSSFGEGLASIGQTSDLSSFSSNSSVNTSLHGAFVNIYLIPHLNFSGQTLDTTGIVTMSSENITGFGKINGPVTANGSVFVAGGTLDLGGGGQVQLNGPTNVGANATLILRDVDQARLLGNTTLATGSKLDSSNGVRLESFRTLTANGSATVEGAFTNQGHVRGPLGSSQLTFAGIVNGAGDYTGNIQFANTFAPGNSPALVNFYGNATFAASSELEMELAGLSDYDKIVVDGVLTLEGGALDVLYLGGFTAQAGNVFDLFDWGILHGTFGEVHLPDLSSGLTWDLSRLYVDGSISVRALTAPVPEPETYAMLLAGLGLLGFAARRRKQKELAA